MKTKEDFLKWKQMSQKLKDLKDEEQKLRRELCSSLFGIKLGTFTSKIDLDNLKIVAKSKITQTIDKNVLAHIYEELSDNDKAAIRYQPELVAVNYKSLPVDSVLHEAVTEKPAMPTLTVEVTI